MHILSEHGHGVGAIANALNIRRKMNKEDIVSCSTVQIFIKQSPLTLKTRITTKKTGKTDMDIGEACPVQAVPDHVGGRDGSWNYAEWRAN